MKFCAPTLASLAPQQPRAVGLLGRLGPSSRRPHAIALVGAPATGVRHLASAFARALLCRHPKSPWDACMDCEDCLAASGAGQGRLLQLGGTQGAPGVVEVRALEGRLAMTSGEGAGKVVLVPRACQLRVPAQNALLKVLEEPPEGTTFVLWVERFAALLPTVRSRLVRIQLAAPPKQVVYDTLTAHGIVSELVPLIAPFVGTDVEAAKHLVDLGAAELASELKEHLTLGTPSSQTARFAQRLAQNRPMGELALGLLEVMLRDALAHRLCRPTALDADAQARALWIEASPAQMGTAIARLNEAREREVFNLNRALLCETLLLTLNRRDTPQ